MKVQTRSIIHLASSAFRSPSGKARKRSNGSCPSSSLLPPLLEAPLAGARLEVIDVAEDHGQQRGGAFTLSAAS